MSSSPPPPTRPATAALRIALAYLAASAVWILGSDLLLSGLVEVHDLAVVQSVKGLVFVSGTALALFVLVRRELSARQASEQATREARRQLETLIANLPGMVFRCRNEPTWPLEFVSEGCRELLGCPASDLLAGRPNLGDLIHEEDRSRLWKEVQQALRERRAYVATYRLRGVDGRERWVWEQGSGIYLPDGRVEALEGFAIDVTDRKELEHQLIHAQKMEAIGRLAAGVAHDFNNLLSVIMGYGELLELRLASQPKLQEQVTAIRAAGERAAALTRRLLAFSRREPARRRVVDLREVLAGIEKLLRRLIGEDVDLVVTLTAEAAWAEVDPSHVEQVVMNLAINARDAMPDGGVLRLGLFQRARAASAQGDVVLSVRDTGHGMDPETVERIYEPFFTTKGAGQGTGLGLAIVYGLVQQNEGRIEVRSRPGAGTTFEVAFPCREEGSAARAPAAPARLLAPLAATVLVVEDQESVLELVRVVLEQAGHRVLTAGSGDEALTVTEGVEEVDVLLADLVMPGISGTELAGRLRERYPRLRTLYMSGYDAVAADAVEGAPPDLLRKPFTPTQLERRVRRLLEPRPPAPGEGVE